MNKIILQIMMLEDYPKIAGDSKIVSELQKMREQNLSDLNEKSVVTLELLLEQQKIMPSLRWRWKQRFWRFGLSVETEGRAISCNGDKQKKC